MRYESGWRTNMHASLGFSLGAAGVALPAVVALGCGGAVQAAADDVRRDAGPETPAIGADAGPPRPGCAAELAAAFPVAGPRRTTPVAQSPEVKRCCETELSRADATSSPHRWDCCATYDATANDGATFGLSPEDLALGNEHPGVCAP